MMILKENSCMKIIIKVARDSVAMGDDCTAPNAKEFEVESNSTLADFCHLIIKNDYFPPIQGGEATWVLTFQNQPIAVLAQQWESPKYLVDSSDTISSYMNYLIDPPHYHFWFDYKCQKDPEKIYRNLKP